VYGGQQFNDSQQYGNQQAFDAQYFGGQMNVNGQQYGNQQAFEGQQFGNQPGYGDMAAFEQQAFDSGQQHYNQMPESTYGNPNQTAFPGSNQVPGMGQQSLGSQPGQSMPANQRWRSPQQNQPSFGQDQMPFPNNGHTGQ